MPGGRIDHKVNRGCFLREVKECIDNIIKIYLEFAELGGIKINIKISGLIIVFYKFKVENIANQV